MVGIMLSAAILLITVAAEAREGAYEKMVKRYEDSSKSADTVAPITRETVEYTSADLRDPFQGMNTRVDTSKSQTQKGPSVLPKLLCQGIMWGGNFNQAIINNKVLKSGDSIEGARIISIELNKIILLFEGHKYYLSVAGELKAGEMPKQPETLKED